MKTDKKKLLKKVIAVSLLASMAVTNQMSYVAPMAYAFTEDAEAKLAQITETYDISKLAESFVETPENGGIISINIDQAGTYLFKGSNVVNEGTGEEYSIDVVVTVAEGVTANLIFDELEIVNKNGTYEDSSGNISFVGVANSPFVINGTANVYIKGDSVLTADQEMRGSFFSGSGTVNFMESENGAMLTTYVIDTTNIGVYGAYLDAVPGGSLKMTDGYCGSTEIWLNMDDVITGGYCALHNGSSYPTDGNGNNVYRSTLEGLPEDTRVVSYNGKTYNFTYTDADGKLITFLPDLTQSGLAIAVGDEVYLYEADNITPGTNDYSATIYTFSDPTPLVDGIKLTKEYGDSEFGLTVNADATVDESVTELKVNSADPISETDAGEYSTNAEISFSYGGHDYTLDIEVPVEITAKELTATITAEDKEYDGTSDAEVTVEFEGLAVNDALTADDYTVISADFEDEKAGSDKTVTATIELSADITNYVLAEDTAETTADISAKEVTFTATAKDKTYDGKTDAEVTVELDGIIEGEVMDTTVSAVFADKNAGENKVVTGSVELASEGAENYVLADDGKFETKASIKKAALKITDITSSDKLFDGSANALVADVQFDADEKIDYTVTGKFDSAEAGEDKSVTATVTLTGNSALNYEFEGGKTTAEFTKKTDSDIIDINGVADDEDSVFTYKAVADMSGLVEPKAFTKAADIAGETSFTYIVDEESTYDIYFVYKKKIADLGTNDTATMYAALSANGWMTREMTTGDYFTKVIFGSETYTVEEGYGLFIYRILDVPDKYTIYASEDIVLSDEA